MRALDRNQRIDKDRVQLRRRATMIAIVSVGILATALFTVLFLLSMPSDVDLHQVRVPLPPAKAVLSTPRGRARATPKYNPPKAEIQSVTREIIVAHERRQEAMLWGNNIGAAAYAWAARDEEDVFETYSNFSTLENAMVTYPHYVRREFDDMKFGLLHLQRISPPMPCAADFQDMHLQAAAKYIINARMQLGAWTERVHLGNRTHWMVARIAFRNEWNKLAAFFSRQYIFPPSSTSGAAYCKRTVVSISTLPTRIAKLGGFIEAVKLQIVQPDAILIGVPPLATRLGQAYTIPAEIANDPYIQIVHLPIDFGPVSKLMAALQQETDPDTCIITMDDDVEPHEGDIQALVSWAAVLPGVAVGFDGWNKSCIGSSMPWSCPLGMDSYVFVRQADDMMCEEASLLTYGDRECYTPVATEPRGTEVLQGVGGVLYRRGMFGEEFTYIPRYVARVKLQTVVDQLEQNVTIGLTKDQKEILRLSKEALSHPGIASIPEEDRLDRIGVPAELYLVDDVYISAFLHSQDTPRMVVPKTSHSELPIPLAPMTNITTYQHMLKGNYEVALRTIDALHGEQLFNFANFVAVRFLTFLGWW